MQRDGVLRQMQHLCSPGLLRNHKHPLRLLALSNLHPGHQTQVRALPQQGWSHESDQVRPEVGPRQLRPLDPRGEHWVRGEDGADHEDLEDSSESVEPGLRLVQGASRLLHSVLGQDLQGGLPRDLRLQTRSGDESHHRR